MSVATKSATQQKLGSNILLDAGTNELEVLVFYLDDRKYGINGAKVREVVNPPKIRPVPGAHEVLRGICKLRDDVMPMISLRKYLNLGGGDQSLPENSQVIVAVFNEQSVAVQVDRVDRIYRISWKNMRPIPRLLESERNQFTGMTIIEEDIVLMVDLEKIAEEISGQQARISAQITTNEGKPLAGKTVVYAEDSQIIQAMTCDILRSAGVSELHVFGNGSDAWNWLDANHEQVPPDVIVSDIEMPLMDGLHLATRIRSHARLKSTPIVLLSSLINPENLKKGQAVGVNDQLVKSKIDMLPTVIRKVLRDG